MTVLAYERRLEIPGLADLPKIELRVRVAAICCFFAVLTMAARRYRLDDSYIYGRYVLHAYQGRGLVFNSGEPINALTSVLDTWLQLALTFLLHGRVMLAQAILGGTFLLGTLILAELTVPFAGVLLSCVSYFYFCTGMETPLFVFLVALTINVYLAGKINWLPLLCALCVLARFEGGALALVIAWLLMRNKRYPSPAAYLPAVLLAIIYVTLNLHFYGTLLPQSAGAKLGQGMAGFWGEWPTAFLTIPQKVFRPLGGNRDALFLLMMIAWFGSKDPRMAERNKVALPFLLILGSFYVLLNIPNYFWYYGPFIYLFTLYAARMIPENDTFKRMLALVIFMSFVASYHYLRENGIEEQDYAQAAKWLQQNTPPGTTIAAVETGTIGWYCDRNIIDIVGLTTPINAKYTEHRDFSSWIKESPDYVVSHSDLRFPWENVASADPNYVLLPVKFGYVTLLKRKTPAVPTTPHGNPQADPTLQARR
jgi:hypothetical protein